MTSESTLLHVRAVSKQYPASPEPTVVLKDASLEMAPGETAAVTGPSGCGKSTLLNLIGALDIPSGGSIFFRGREVAFLSPVERARFRNREIGFVLQRHHLLPHCSVLENVLAPAVVHPDRENALSRALSLLGRVGLSARMDRLPGQLSGGECQRAAVVRALINRPQLLLADEPTGSLNRQAADDLVTLLLELNREEGMALLMVTHSMRLAERLGCAYELRDGRLEPGT